MKQLTVYSNSNWLAATSDERVVFKKIRELSTNRMLSWIDFLHTTIFLTAKEIDVIFIMNPLLKNMLVVSFYKILGGKAKIIYYDLNLKKPANPKEIFLSRIVIAALRRADKIICLHKDISDFKKYYKMDPVKVSYIPFKVNNFESCKNYRVHDEGYILSCGVSHRDYELLFKAVKSYPYDVRVVCPSRQYAKFIGSKTIPANVRLLKHEDTNLVSWYNLIAGAKFVVLPIEKECIYPAGTSVYLEAMMLKKAVIISDGPSSNDLIDSSIALIVRRGDEGELRQAIKQLYDDEELRGRYARNGYVYAMNLQGNDRLLRDIKSELFEDRHEETCDALKRFNHDD